MEENVIEVNDLTKDYGFGRGVFDISFNVPKGEVFGYLGPNGAGKTTTIRHLMGFSTPQKGTVKIFGLDCFKDAKKIEEDVGYLPGEIALPENMTGEEFLKHMAGLRKITDMSNTERLLKIFNLDVKSKRKLKRYALGERRKLAIVTAFMHDPKLLILDEPTSGLDPIGQVEFIKFIEEEKKKGKTILLSSHIFNEVESVCDRIAIIKAGKIVSICSIDEIKHRNNKTFYIGFKNLENYNKFLNENFNFILKQENQLQVKIYIDDKETTDLIKTLSGYELKYFAEEKYSLEDYFMHFYEKEEKWAISNLKM